MGAFSAIGEGISKGLSKLADAGVAAIDHSFEAHDEGKFTKDRLNNVYFPVLNQTREALSKHALDIADQEKAHLKVFMDSGQTGPAPIVNPIDHGKIHAEAVKAARYETFGPKDGLGVTLAASIEKKHGVLAAQNYSNALAFIMKDYVDPMTNRSQAPGISQSQKYKIQAPYSSFKKNAVSAGVGLTSIEPSYIPKGADQRSVFGRKEKAITNAMYQAFSPLIMVPHLATVFNGLFGANPVVFMKALAKSLGPGLDSKIDSMQSLVTSGAFAETHMRDIAEHNRFVATQVPNFTNGSAAYYAHKLFHQPGFSLLRNYSLLSGANMGKMVAEQSALDFVKDPTSVKSLWQMREFGLDPQKIISQNGKLDEEDLGRAIYKFVDKHYFIDSSMQRSTLLQSTWQGRMLGAYHSYVTRQAKLMANSMAFELFKGAGPVRVMKNLAIGAVLFPAMGEGIKVIQETYRGEDAGGDLHKDLTDLSGKRGAEAQLSAYAQMFGHVAAFGVYTHLLRGALTHNLVSSAAGPLISSVGELGEDTTSAIRKIYRDKAKHKQKDWAPVERDLAFDTPGISLLAQVLAHRIFPNAKDNPKKDPIREMYKAMSSDDKPQDSTSEDSKQ